MPGFSRRQRDGSAGKRYLLGAAGVVLLVASGFLISANVKLYKKQRELSGQVARSQEEYATLESDNRDLRAKIENYNNPEYIEKVAREEANMKKPGETAVSFVAAPKPEAAPEDDIFTPGFWTRLWDRVVGFFK